MANDFRKLTDEELDRELLMLSSKGKSADQLSDEELDATIASLGGQQKPQQKASSSPDFIRGAFEAAPAALAGLGGAVGATAAGVPTLGLGAPGGGLVGAGLGGMVGSGIRSIGRKYVYDQPETTGEMYKSAFVAEPVMGIAGEAGGQVVSKGLNVVGKSLSDLVKQKSNAEAIKQAAKNIGVKPTEGMLSASPTIQGLESSLEQSPTLAGSIARKGTEGPREAIRKAVGGLVEEGTSLSPYEVGEQVKTGMVARIGEKTGPASMMFENVKAMTKDIPIDKKSIARVAKNIEKIDEVRLLPKESWSTKARSYAEALGNAQSADEIATIRKTVGEDFRSAEGPERMVLGKLYDKLSKLENNTIMRGAVRAARNAKEGGEIGKDLVEESLSARKQWKEIYKSLNEFSEATGLKVGGRENITNILDAIESMPAESVSKKFFNTGNLNAMNVMKKKFPEQFDLLRQAKISELQKLSTGADGQLNAASFRRNIKSMGPEVTELVFGEGSKGRIDDIVTVMQSNPKMMGPSGTPQGLDFRDMLNPMLQARDIGRLGILKGQGPIRSTGEALRGLPIENQIPGGKMKIGVTNIPATIGARSAIERRLQKLKDGK